MKSTKLILAIDQGTTSSRAMVFDTNGKVIAKAQQEFTQIYPNNGWVEHDPEQLWESTIETCKQAIAQASASGTIVGIGITNQRETTLIWDRRSGKPIYNAIVWQDRRTAEYCNQLKNSGLEPEITGKTGLLADPYFSGTKIRWILENVPGARSKAENGELAFGTVDSFLIWRLTGGSVHATDATNASRSLLFNIHTGEWDSDLLEMLDVPIALLPEVNNCADDFGQTDDGLFGTRLPIAAVAGDQQSALVGQACFKPGMAKCTYGTGCFLMMNTGLVAAESNHKLLTTIGYRLNDVTTYALEGSIFNAGTAIQWLRDGINVIDDTSEIQQYLDSTHTNRGLYLVPAFTGLGAPHWNPNARGILSGITRNTNRSDLVRAAIESVCYQTNDLINAMVEDSNMSPEEIRVDGGMTVNRWMLQYLANMTRSRISKPSITETTALGVAYLAALQLGIQDSVETIAQSWKREETFDSDMDIEVRDGLVKDWTTAIDRCMFQS